MDTNPFDPLFDAFEAELKRFIRVSHYGLLREIAGPTLRAVMPHCRIGDLCELRCPQTRNLLVLAEVIGFDGQMSLLSPFDSIGGLAPGTLVVPLEGGHRVKVGTALLGEVLDGLGRPLQGVMPEGLEAEWPVLRPPPNPMDRPLIDRPFATGIRCIDGFAPLGVGQRVGVFAAAGVGKSSLLSMLARNADADINVVALIGERGREVKDFLERGLPAHARRRTVTVVATSDQPALQRVRAAHVAMTIAEYFREQGAHVMLLMDSVTRFARGLRELGLAAGEPPTRRGFPSSVFAELPRLVERAGCAGKGAITALFTVLVEGDDMTEPVADEMRSLLDGHLILSRELAAANHYPALDVLESASRLAGAVSDAEHMQLAGELRKLMAAYKDVELLIKMGEYQAGADPTADRAVAVKQSLDAFLRQPSHERVALAHTVACMRAIIHDEWQAA